MKRYITILIVIVVIALVAVIGLYFWKSASSSPNTPGAGTTGTLPSTGTQGTSGGTGTSGTTGGTGTGTTGSTGTSTAVAGSFGPVSNDPVLNYFVEPNNTILALEPNGVVAEIANGQTSHLSSSTASNVIAGSFSHDGKKALVSFGAPGTAPQTSIFNVATNAWTALPQGMQSPTWSPTSGDYRIAYLASAATGTETLATIDAANPKQAPVALLTLHINDLSVQWIGKAEFVLSDKPSTYAPGSAFLFNSATQSLTLLASGLPGLESTWSGTFGTSSPEGLVFSSNSSGAGGNLQLENLLGVPLQNLAIETLPTKCGFGTATAPSSTSYLALYCGVPRDGTSFSSANLPDEYNQMALFTSDDIYQINTQTGAINTLWSDANENIDVSDLTAVSSSLFFINRYDQKLYTLTIQTE